jgi:WD40 repeat protein
MFPVEHGRVIEFDGDHADILLSTSPAGYPATDGLTHGVMKMACRDINTRYYLALHSKPIRDLKYHPDRQLLLSCSFDRTLKLSHMGQGSIVNSFDLPHQAWSCCWNSYNDVYVHAGLQSGELYTFDIRMPKGSVPVFTLSLPSKQPVHSLISVGSSIDPESDLHGLIAATGAHVAVCKSPTSLKSWELFEAPLLSQVSHNHLPYSHDHTDVSNATLFSHSYLYLLRAVV